MKIASRIAGAVISVLCHAAPAVERPWVGVSFTLEEARLRGAFTANQLRDVETRAARMIAGRLGERLGFVAFSGAPEAGGYVLNVRLQPDAQTAADTRKRTILRIQLSGPDVQGELDTWEFRPATRYSEGSGGVEGLVREIEVRLAALDLRALVAALLSKVPIAREARVWTNPRGWVIPYRHAELCMKDESLLLIHSELPVGGGLRLPRQIKAKASGSFAIPGAPADLLERVFTEPVADNERQHLDELRTAREGDVTVKAVYVTEYRQLTPCAPVSIDEVISSGVRR